MADKGDEEPTVGPGRRKAEATKTRQELKAAAKRVFVRRGYLNTKITDITGEAGRATGSFYNHFAGKEALLESMREDMLAAGDALVTDPDSSHSPDFTDPAAVRWHIAGYWRFHQEYAVELTALRQAALVSDDFSARIARLGAEDQQHMLDHLEHVRRVGRSLPGDPDTVVAMLSGLVDAFTQRWHDCDPATRVAEEQAIDVLTTFAYRALNGCDP